MGRFDLGPLRSELITAQQFLDALLEATSHVPDDPSVLTREELERADAELTRAIICVAEMMKLVPIDGDRIAGTDDPRFERRWLSDEYKQLRRLVGRYARASTIDDAAFAAHEAWVRAGAKGPGQLRLEGNKLARELYGAVDLTLSEIVRSDLTAIDLAEARLQFALLEEDVLRFANLRAARLPDAAIRGGDWTCLNASDATFVHADIRDTDFSRSEMEASLWSEAGVRRARFDGVRFGNAVFDGASFESCSFIDASFAKFTDQPEPTTRGARFVDCDLTGCDWTERSLAGASFVRCKLAGAHGKPSSVDGLEVDGCDLDRAMLLGQLGYSAMAAQIFRVSGVVAYAGGEPADGVFVAIVDADPDCDDLLGVGVTSGVGGFFLAFTKEAFNQEPGENEARPDLYVVISIEDGASRVPVLRRDFPGLRFDDQEDLGTIVLPFARGARPPAAPGLRSAPGASKIVKRIRLDREIVEQAASEIVGLVERVTGWRSLLDGTGFAIVDSFDDLQRRRVARVVGQRELSDAEMSLVRRRAATCDLRTLALWENEERIVYLNRAILEAQNYDALRIALAHELVHVGQSKMHPDLDAEMSANHAEIVRHTLAGTEPSKEREQAMAQFLANIEGYASYVERFLLGFYTHGTTIDGARLVARISLEERAAPPLARGTPQNESWRDILQDGMTTKENQYLSGFAAYLARARNGSARFDPELRPELLYDRKTLGLVEASAKLGDAPSQLELGMVLAEGKHGVGRDVEGAKRWFRSAAQAGLATAAYLLASQLDPDDEERLRWFRAAAEQGYSPAQRSLAIELLRGPDPARDHAEAVAWLEKAAAQGDEDAVRDLALYRTITCCAEASSPP